MSSVPLNQHKSMFEIAMELNRLHEQSLTGYLSPQDITGGTFSLSNIGAVSLGYWAVESLYEGMGHDTMACSFQIGGTYNRPMLLPPEVVIGAFGKVQVSF